MTKNVEFATFTQTVMIRTVLLNTGSSPNIKQSWIWDKYSLFTDGPCRQTDTGADGNTLLPSSMKVEAHSEYQNAAADLRCTGNGQPRLSSTDGSPTIEVKGLKQFSGFSTVGLTSAPSSYRVIQLCVTDLIENDKISRSIAGIDQ